MKTKLIFSGIGLLFLLIAGYSGYRYVFGVRIVITQEEIETARLTQQLKQTDLRAQIDSVPFRYAFFQYGSLATLAVCLGSVVAIVTCFNRAHLRRARVHTARIGTNEIPVDQADLSKLYPVMLGLTQAQIEAASGQIQERTIELTNQQLTNFALLGKSFLSKRGLPEIAEAQEPLALSEGASMPSFQDILAELHEGDPMFLGFDYETGEPIKGSFNELYSSFLAGKSGSGKSSWLRGLILQSLKCYPGVNYFVLDPHAGHGESVSKDLPKTDNFTYLDTGDPRKGFYDFNRILQARLDHPNGDRPAVFVVDELSFCSRQKYAPTLSTLLERISNEGRKAKCYALLSSQDCRIKRTGDFRDMLSSSYCFALKPAQSRLLLQDRDEQAKVKMLHEQKIKGVALFSPSENESRLVKVPFCQTSDVQRLTFVTPAAAHQVKTNVKQDTLNTLEKQPEHLETMSENELIQRQMKTKGISLRTLAKMASIPNSTLSNYLNGKGDLNSENLQKIRESLENPEHLEHSEKQTEQNTLNSDPVMVFNGNEIRQ